MHIKMKIKILQSVYIIIAVMYFKIKCNAKIKTHFFALNYTYEY
jgi:hypothetical protein